MALGKGRKGRKGRKKSPLFYPNQPLAGRSFRQTARALTNIETLPGINAQRNLIQQTNRQERRDLAALGAMGTRLDQQMGDMTGRLRRYGQQAVTAQQANAANLSSRLTANAQASTDRLNQLQGSVLGEQISTLAAQQVQPGTSGSQGRIAQFAQLQQAANAANQQATGNLGAMIGAAGVTNAASTANASLGEAENARMGIARSIASRDADTRAAAGDARREAQSQLATMRSLRGSTMLKNLLDLRREQQQFQLGRAELAQAGAQARRELDIKQQEADTNRLEAQDGGGGGGGEGSNRDELRLGPAEYKQYSAAAKEMLGGKTIGNYNQFLDRLAKQEGVNWSAVERRKFRKRFRKQNPQLFS